MSPKNTHVSNLACKDQRDQLRYRHVKQFIYTNFNRRLAIHPEIVFTTACFTQLLSNLTERPSRIICSLFDRSRSTFDEDIAVCVKIDFYIFVPLPVTCRPIIALFFFSVVNWFADPFTLCAFSAIKLTGAD